MKLLRLVLLALAVACAFPAGASALELEVNTTEDTGDGGCYQPEEACTLREAIIIADASEDEEESRITFGEGAEGVIKPEYPLPELRRGIEVDATTAPGWEGSPVVELDGSETTSESGTEGLRVAEGARAKIRGLAIGGFGLGIYFEHGSSGEVCGNYLGTDLTGTEARPNFDGIWIDEEARNVQVGRLCGEIGGNLVSGNEEWGIVAAGKEIEIDQNLVGTDASGEAALPNGPTEVEAEGGGIRVGPHAVELTVGGIDELGLPHNVIAFNRGPGVLVEGGAAFATVRENSIFSNEGLGIESPASTATAEITSVGPIEKGTTMVAGKVQGLPDREYDLEFFSSEECDPSGFGEGQFFVGAIGDEVETDSAGSADFSAKLLALVLPAAHFFTLTATDRPRTSTSEFSNCVSAPPAAEEERQQLPPPPPPLPPIPTPVNGKSVTIAPKSGRVLVKVPGSNRFVPLSGLASVPVGSIIDATNGRVTLTSVDANGVTQTADFYEGRFQVLQRAGGALVTLRLRGGDFSSCPKPGGSSAHAAKKSGRRLWGSGSGRFRTQGNFGSASVMGTIWLTADQCNGTFFKVRRGVVKVADFVLDRTISLAAGRSYLAKKP
ncbi:MAG TPA: CSLREA domain-containing protein [Solirubrobacterales bacterium]